MHDKRVLVVDGCERVRRTLELLLRPRGFEVEAAGSAAEGLRRARASRPRAVLVAAHTLGAGPLDIGPRLQEEPDLADLPVIEVDRLQDIVREIQDGWERCGAASRELLGRLERLAQSPWQDPEARDASPCTWKSYRPTWPARRGSD
ncbi:MAG: hypothetical protein CL910_11950 [Deltaproteobacteria bacterium]|jgi:CheY-like chemotaxis protein|nr:hypothetical protein [Deltaproteobacteria bacterium]